MKADYWFYPVKLLNNLDYLFPALPNYDYGWRLSNLGPLRAKVLLLAGLFSSLFVYFLLPIYLFSISKLLMLLGISGLGTYKWRVVVFVLNGESTPIYLPIVGLLLLIGSFCELDGIIIDLNLFFLSPRYRFYGTCWLSSSPVVSSIFLALCIGVLYLRTNFFYGTFVITPGEGISPASSIAAMFIGATLIFLRSND